MSMLRQKTYHAKPQRKQAPPAPKRPPPEVIEQDDDEDEAEKSATIAFMNMAIKPIDANKQEQLAREEEMLSLLMELNKPVLNDELPATLQAVKAHLYAREYAAAFGRDAYLRAYAARWVSGRSLAYRSLLLDIPELVETSQRRARQGQITRTFCIGGGAGSEILALASLTKELEFDVKMHVTAVDVADWNEILTEMGDLIKTRWKEQGMETENKFKLEFKRANMLQDFNDLHFEEQHIITCLFTTNELFAESRVKTMALLSHLSNTCKKGTLLVIAESTGTYSEIQMGSKVYPLELVLDMTLVGKNKEWEIVKQEQSRWYRVPEESKGKYELQIENTHMLVRVYRKA